MCKVSDKLKLCSCKAENVDRLRHYWVLKRPEDLGQDIMGTVMPPADIGEDVEKFNNRRLQKHLNDRDCFDVELFHQENDILELHFTCVQKPLLGDGFDYSGNYLVYVFVYKKAKWRTTLHDPFGNNLIDVQGGKILKPFITRANQ